MQHEPLAPGFVVAGKYKIERTLGRGGMGAVYVVSHVTTGKRLALKCLLPEFVPNADIVGRFLREAQVMGRLQHRHVVDVFDVGRDGDVLYIVMELLDGRPLSDLLHDSTLTLEEALLIILRAMEGVAAAHDQGVIHRDLKPDNIFVCVGASGRLDDPRVLDFGISKLEGGAEQLTRSGVAMGTPNYMSIEQLNGQRDLDQRVDVYALGVILYEAISGEPPYLADSMSALAIRVLTTDATHLAELRPDLPPGLADVVMKAIAKSRDDRYRSVRQLIEALRPYLPRSTGLSLPEGQSRPLRTPRGAGSRRPPPVSAISDVLGRKHELPGASGRPSRMDEPATSPSSGWAKRIAIGATILAISGGLALLAQRKREEVPMHEPAPSASPDAERQLAPPAVPAPVVPPSPRLVEVAPEQAAVTSPRPTGQAETPDAGSLAADKGRAPARKPPQRSTPSVEKPAAAAPPSQPASAARPQPAPPAPQTHPAPQANPAPSPRKSAEGRAGKLGSDEF